LPSPSQPRGEQDDWQTAGRNGKSKPVEKTVEEHVPLSPESEVGATGEHVPLSPESEVDRLIVGDPFHHNADILSAYP
jgi:hypothetical protein